jgi:hypothetical protein
MAVGCQLAQGSLHRSLLSQCRLSSSLKASLNLVLAVLEKRQAWLGRQSAQAVLYIHACKSVHFVKFFELDRLCTPRKRTAWLGRQSAQAVLYIHACKSVHFVKLSKLDRLCTSGRHVLAVDMHRLFFTLKLRWYYSQGQSQVSGIFKATVRLLLLRCGPGCGSVVDLGSRLRSG